MRIRTEFNPAHHTFPPDPGARLGLSNVPLHPGDPLRSVEVERSNVKPDQYLILADCWGSRPWADSGLSMPLDLLMKQPAVCARRHILREYGYRADLPLGFCPSKLDGQSAILVCCPTAWLKFRFNLQSQFVKFVECSWPARGFQIVNRRVTDLQYSYAFPSIFERQVRDYLLIQHVSNEFIFRYAAHSAMLFLSTALFKGASRSVDDLTRWRFLPLLSIHRIICIGHARFQRAFTGATVASVSIELASLLRLRGKTPESFFCSSDCSRSASGIVDVQSV